MGSGEWGVGERCSSPLPTPHYSLPTHNVFVTFDSDLGLSGVSPLASASRAANIWAGMMYGIGETSSLTRSGILIWRDADLSAAGSLEITIVSAPMVFTFSSSSLVPFR